MPSIRGITDQWLEGRFDHGPASSTNHTKTGAPHCHPVKALLIRGSKPDHRMVRIGASD
jgi:hypothetical protein